MPTVYASPLGVKPQYEDSAGLPAVGYRLFFYVGGSVGTKQNTYTDSTGSVANSNPITLNSLGQPTTEIWFISGLYKVVLAPPGSDDPPSSPVWSVDNVRGINDTTVSFSQWASGPTPTFINTTQFSIAGDQTSSFQVGRRAQVTDSVTTKYGRISVSTYDGISLTTVTLVLDGGAVLVTPLSAVSYGLITPTDTSEPVLPDTVFLISGSSDRTKLVRFEVDGLTTATTRVMTIPDRSMTLGDVASSITLTAAGLVTGGGDLTANRSFTVGAASQADQETASSTSVAVTPGVQKFHPGSAKAWIQHNTSAGTTQAAYNVSSVTYHGAGDFTVNFSTAFSAATYCAVGLCSEYIAAQSSTGLAAGSCRMWIFNTAYVNVDATRDFRAFFGDQ